MGYQALLFCPDEKTARTVTQVLSELEFSVESCTEPFAAVKKLMGGHYDAIVVDCDNEQNATLLFKSAHNSPSNQTSLAVAVVEGQTGVAKAFRIGANLVLTKPINVEQAKGTLRVARGLLRKGDPAKSAASVATTQAPAPAKTIGATSTPTKPAPQLGTPAVPAQVAKPAAPPAAKPAAASARTTIPAPVAQTPDSDEPDVLEIDADEPIATAPAAIKSEPAPAFSKPFAGADAASSTPAHFAGSSFSAAGTGAASAAAPARVTPEPKFEPPARASDAEAAAKTLELDQLAIQASDSSFPEPSFTFGGANVPDESKGGGTRKALIGVAAAALIAAGLYFGWTQYHARSVSPSPVVERPAPTTTVIPQGAVSSKPQTTLSPSQKSSAGVASSPASQPAAQSNSPADIAEEDVNSDGSDEGPEKSGTAVKNSAKGAKTGAAAAVKPSPESKPASQPIMVKNGTTTTAQAKSAPAADAPAPSVLGIATASSGGGLPNLVANSNAPKPVLQTLNVSQGVSQGLLIKKVQPVYPPTALRMHTEGAVQLTATIGTNGNITAVKVISGEPLLARAALDAVKQWKYKPYYLNGEPVEIQTQVTVNFKLPK